MGSTSLLTKIKLFFKTKQAVSLEKLLESYLFAAFGAEAVYFVNRGYDWLNGTKFHVNWSTVGFIFAYGVGAPVLRLLDAKFPVLTKFSNKLISILSGKATTTP